MNLSEATNKVIELDRKIRDYYDAEIPKWLPNYPLVGPGEEEPPPPPEERDLEAFLSTLSEDILFRMLLVMRFGWGAMGVDKLSENYETLKDTIGDRDEAVGELMMEKTALADQISDGLEELRKHKINVDRIPLKKVKLRKQ